MASLKDIKLRIKSVKTTQQATRAMKMVSAAKLRKAQDTALRMRPYSSKLNELLGRLVASLDGSSFVSEYAPTDRAVNKVLVVLVTSNRGLAGAFNANVCKLAQAVIDDQYASYVKAGNLQVLCVGKKGYEYMAKRKYAVYQNKNFDVFQNISFDTVNPVIEEVMQGYLAGKWDKVLLVYNEFKNMMAQNRISEQFLPVAKPEAQAGAAQRDYIYEPSRDEIVTALIPKILKTRLYRAVLESNLSEHAARMVAMDNATTNAQDLIKALQLQYNKARQAAITKEIIEIVSGAEALSA